MSRYGSLVNTNLFDNNKKAHGSKLSYSGTLTLLGEQDKKAKIMQMSEEKGTKRTRCQQLEGCIGCKQEKRNEKVLKHALKYGKS